MGVGYFQRNTKLPLPPVIVTTGRDELARGKINLALFKAFKNKRDMDLSRRKYLLKRKRKVILRRAPISEKNKKAFRQETQTIARLGIKARGVDRVPRSLHWEFQMNIDRLFKSRVPRLYRTAWRLYVIRFQKLAGKDLTKYSSLLLDYLKSSENVRDLERALLAARYIKVSNRTNLDMKNITMIYLKLGKFNEAFGAFEKYAKHHKAWQDQFLKVQGVAFQRKVRLGENIFEKAGIEALIAECIVMNNWFRALKIWDVVASVDGGILMARNVVEANPQIAVMILKWIRSTSSEDVGLVGRVRSLALFLVRGAIQSITQAHTNFINVHIYTEMREVLEKRGWLEYNDTLQIHITECLARKQTQSAKQLYLKYRTNMGKNPDTAIINAILRLNVREGDFEGLKMALKDLESVGCKPEEYSYDVIMQEFASRGQTEVVDRFFQDYTKVFRPESNIFAHVIRARAQRGEMRSALEVFDIMEKLNVDPNLRCYTTMMVGYSWSRDITGVLDMMRRILATGMTPNITAYNSLMYVSAIRGDADSLQYVMRMAKIAGKATDQMYNFLIMAFVRQRRMVSAKKVLDHYESMDPVNPRLDIYNSMLNGYATLRREKEFDGLYSKMLMLNLRPNKHTHALRLFNLCKASKTDMAEKVLLNEIEHPNTIHFNIVMTANIKRGNFAKVWELYDRMVDRGIKPSYPIYTQLIQNAVLEAIAESPANRNVDELLGRASALLELAISKSPMVDMSSTYSIRSAIPPDIFTPLVRGFTRVGSPQRAHMEYEVFLKLANDQSPDGAKPTRSILHPVMVAQVQMRHWEAVRDTWHRLKATSLKLARELPIQTITPTIVYSQRHMMAKPFQILIRAAIEGNPEQPNENPISYRELIKEFDELAYHGFYLDNRNWNSYVTTLAALMPSLAPAFKVCEDTLIDPYIDRKKANQNTETRISRYHLIALESTISTLAAEVLIRQREASSNSEQSARVEEEMRFISSRFPKTFGFCQQVQNLEDLSISILQGKARRNRGYTPLQFDDSGREAELPFDDEAPRVWGDDNNNFESPFP